MISPLYTGVGIFTMIFGHTIPGVRKDVYNYQAQHGAQLGRLVPALELDSRSYTVISCSPRSLSDAAVGIHVSATNSFPALSSFLPRIASLLHVIPHLRKTPYVFSAAGSLLAQ